MINRLIANILPYLPKKLIWVFSKRYIAGETIDDAINASKKLNSEGILVTIDLLGEFISNLTQAEENKNKYLEIIQCFRYDSFQGNFSLKPTMFGLLIDEEVCYLHIREIVAKAAENNNFIRVDMEDSQCVDAELNIFKKLKKEFPNNVGLVVQAYLRRTLDDITNLRNLYVNGQSVNFRICKGIYVEPEHIAFKEYQEVRDHYLEDLEFMFKNNIYAAIATHDKYLIKESYNLIEKYRVPKDKYEFQMLYGVTPDLRKSVVANGHQMRVYVPFGKEWFGYSTRRLKENPQMATHIIKAIFYRG